VLFVHWAKFDGVSQETGLFFNPAGVPVRTKIKKKRKNERGKNEKKKRNTVTNNTRLWLRITSSVGRNLVVNLILTSSLIAAKENKRESLRDSFRLRSRDLVVDKHTTRFYWKVRLNASCIWHAKSMLIVIRVTYQFYFSSSARLLWQQKKNPRSLVRSRGKRWAVRDADDREMPPVLRRVRGVEK